MTTRAEFGREHSEVLLRDSRLTVRPVSQPYNAKMRTSGAYIVPSDTSFFQCFLLTFRSFTNPPELFELLVERYNIEEPEGLNAGEALDWRKLKQTPIRLR